MASDSPPPAITEPASEPPQKRRRAVEACVSCRNRKSRCSGGRPKCSTCTELGFTCQYLTTAHGGDIVVVGKEHFQAIEDRLNQLESLLRDSPSDGRGFKRPRSDVDLRDRHVPTPSSSLAGDGSASIVSQDPTDGMGVLVFGNEEDRAYFGSSSNISFTTDLSRTLKRLSRSRGNFTPGSSHTSLFDFHIARVSRPSSPVPYSNPWVANNPEHNSTPTSSIFYLPPDGETLALIDRYFADKGLLYPYIHEETFRENYAQLKRNHTVTRRTWLGVLNIVLALATLTTIYPAGDAEKRRVEADAFYQRANALCAEHVMNGATLEIVQYLLLVTQYMQGTRSGSLTWTTHGLAVKVALQLGLHSAEASKRFSPVEREMRKRTWFGCLAIDRNLSMTFGRPTTIPEHYTRLELPVYYDSFETRHRQIEARQRCRYSTDSFNANIGLSSVIYKTLETLYDSNIGSDEKVADYELITRVLRLRNSLQEWVSQLPPHMNLISARECLTDIGRHPTADRFRIILTMRYHNLRLLIHRIVLVRLCEYIDDGDAHSHETIALQDIVRSTVQITLESATEIINILSTLVESEWAQRGLLGVWWCTVYHTFDAALVIFTIFLLATRSTLVTLPLAHSTDSLKQTFFGSTAPLRQLDIGNQTIEKCCRRLEKLCEVWNVLESNPNSEQAASHDMSSLYLQHQITPPAIVDHSASDLSFLDFDYMANGMFGGVSDGFLFSNGAT
ncbi:fungal-specific transcription factor domain-containing protein [Aspergillus pseudoustus]|uniref:Fungal-specific transcription factor domain-containing protein n=1 Tax=Aspergillus pseudoustus TaxID=1810923 RepID=A0ABR4J5X2_9EURO